MSNYCSGQSFDILLIHICLIIKKYEQFEKLEYDTYKSIYLTFIAGGVATLIAFSNSEGNTKIFLNFLSLLLFFVSIVSLFLFFKFYFKLRNRYS